MSSRIVLKDITKRFAHKHVLNGIDLTIEKGESLVILGGSGSGKSVLIKIIAGLIEQSSGSILVDDAEITARDQLMPKIGFLFQGGALFDSLPVWENVAFRLINCQKLDRKSAKKVALEKLDLVGLSSSVADLYPAELSGGMQKRAALARAIAANPEIIFFDEPTTGLDPIMAEVINELIVSNSRKLGATIITITHDMNSAKVIADKIAMIYQGKIIWSGDAKNMYSSNNEYLDQFIHGRAHGPIEL